MMATLFAWTRALSLAGFLVLASASASAFYFPDHRVAEALAEENFEGLSNAQVAQRAQERLMPVLTKHLIPVMVYPWVQFVSGISPVEFTIHHPDTPGLAPVTRNAGDLVRYHLRRILALSDQYFQADFDEESRREIRQDMADRLEDALVPELEEAWLQFDFATRRFVTG